MLIIHVSSGLGNQMLSYAEFLAFKRMNPEKECYIENIVYEIKQDAIKMWNGYELERIFNIHAPNIREVFTESEWSQIISEIQASKFWLDGKWECGAAYTKALSNHGVVTVNLCETRGWDNNPEKKDFSCKGIAKRILGRNYLLLRNMYWRKALSKNNAKQYGIIEGSSNYLCGGDLKLMYKNHGMDSFEQEIKEAFQFPELTDERNIALNRAIESSNSVSIHIRRGDLLNSNADYYRYGYFKHATEYIRKRINNPVWFIFCLPSDVEWCKQNISSIGINPEEERVTYIDWNSGLESFRDMQLMSTCKHNIITKTSFGFWASYLNSNPNKITISPDECINTNTTVV